MVLLEFGLAAGGAVAVKVITTLYIRYDNNKEYAMMQNRGVQLEFAPLDRVEFARTEAALGFHTCPACGFENFKRISFCNVCGEALDKIAQKREKKSKVANTLGSRAQRAREWTRTVDASTGKTRWTRQTDAKSDFPGFVVMFQSKDRDDATAATGSDATAWDAYSESKTLDLLDEVERVCLNLVDASTANPWTLAVDGTEVNAPEHQQDVLRIAALDFPSKNAQFVAKGVDALAPTKRVQLKVSIDHAYALEQSFEHLSCVEINYARAEMDVKFLDQTGPKGGKMTREWLDELSELLANPSTGLFTLVNTTEQTYYLNKHSREALGDDHLTFFYAAGRLLGRGLLDGNLWGFHLATPLLKIILGQPLSFPDLAFFDPEEYKSLEWLVHNRVDESLALDFSVTETNAAGETVVVDLIPNGRNVAVTDTNKREYLDRKFRYTLFESVSSQLYAFLKGVYEVVPQDMLMPLDFEELDYILCGSDVIDAADWEYHSKYNECIHGHPCKRWFWKHLRTMSLEHKRRLLHFTTGLTRVPIGGFAALTNYSGHVAPFTIVGNELLQGRIIRGQPCFNQILLPNYVKKKEFRANLFGILDNYDAMAK